MGQWKDSSKPSSRQWRLEKGVASSRLRMVRHSEYLSKPCRWTATNSITTHTVTYTKTSAYNTCEVQLITTKSKVAQRLKHTYTCIPYKGDGLSLQHQLQSFILTYRSTPRATTELSPALIFLWSPIHTRFDLLCPNVGRTCAAQASRRVAMTESLLMGVRSWCKGDGQRLEGQISLDSWYCAEMLGTSIIYCSVEQYFSGQEAHWSNPYLRWSES